LIATLVEPPLLEKKKLVGMKDLGGVFRFCFVEKPGLRWIIFAWCMLGTATWTAVWFYPKYFTATGWSVAQQGWIFAFYQLVAGAAALMARRFKPGDRHIYVLFGAFALCASSAHMLFGLTLLSWGFLFGVLHQVCRGAVPVVFSTA